MAFPPRSRRSRSSERRALLIFALSARKRAATAAFGLLLLASASAAGAQEQQPAAGNQRQPPGVEVIATHGGWRVQCEDMPGRQAGTQKMCVMVQGARSEQNPEATLTLVFVKAKPDDKAVNMMRIVTPIGVFLPMGVAIEIDGGAVERVPFTRCLPQYCLAFSEATRDLLDKFKNGETAGFTYYDAPGLGLSIKMGLEDFSAALAELDKL